MKRFFSILTTAFFGLTCMSLFGCSSHLGAGKYSHAEQYSAGNFTYNSKEISRVELNWDSGSVEISESDKETLSVSESGSNLSDAKKLHYWQDGSVLRIQFCKSGFAGTFPLGSKKLRLEIPAGIELVVKSVSAPVNLGEHSLRSLELNSTSGSVRTGNIRTAGDLFINTTSGSVDTANLAVDGTLTLHSTSGTVQTGRSAASNVRLKTTSGSIRADVLECTTVTANSTSGTIRLGLKECESASIDGTSGAVTMNFVDGLGASVGFRSTSGRFKCSDYGVSDGRYIFGDGRCKLDVHTISGSLTVE